MAASAVLTTGAPLQSSGGDLLDAVQAEIISLQALVRGERADHARTKATAVALEGELAEQRKQQGQLLAALDAGHVSAGAEMSAASLHASAVEELSKLQASHLRLTEEHQRQGSELQGRITDLERARDDLEAEMGHMRAQMGDDSARANAEVERLEAQRLAEVQGLHDKYVAQLRAVDSFKNTLLEEKRASAEQWERERGAMRARQGVLEGQGGADRARLAALQGELGAARAERDRYQQQLRAGSRPFRG